MLVAPMAVMVIVVPRRHRWWWHFPFWEGRVRFYNRFGWVVWFKVVWWQWPLWFFDGFRCPIAPIWRVLLWFVHRDRKRKKENKKKMEVEKLSVRGLASAPDRGIILGIGLWRSCFLSSLLLTRRCHVNSFQSRLFAQFFCSLTSLDAEFSNMMSLWLGLKGREKKNEQRKFGYFVIWFLDMFMSHFVGC